MILQLNSAHLNSTQLGSTQLRSTHLDSAPLISAQLSSSHLNNPDRLFSAMETQTQEQIQSFNPPVPTTEVYKQKPGSRSPVIDELVDIFRAMKAGETITYKDLSECVHEDVQYKGRSRLNRAIELVRITHNIVMSNVWGVGFTKLANEDIADHSNVYHRRKLESDTQIYQEKLDCVDPSQLDDSAKQDYVLGQMQCSIRSFMVAPATQRSLKQVTVNDPLSHFDQESFLKAFGGMG